MKIINTKYALQPQANDCGMHVIVCVCQWSAPGKECPPGPGQDRITGVKSMSPGAWHIFFSQGGIGQD